MKIQTRQFFESAHRLSDYDEDCKRVHGHNWIVDIDILKDPDYFPLIRKMWNLMLTGNYTPPQILNIVNDKWEYRTRKTKRIGGNPLSRSGIYRIFTNILSRTINSFDKWW